MPSENPIVEVEITDRGLIGKTIELRQGRFTLDKNGRLVGKVIRKMKLNDAKCLERAKKGIIIKSSGDKKNAPTAHTRRS